MLEETTILACKKCSTIIFDNSLGGDKQPLTPPPVDWSFVKIGTTGDHEGKSFKIVGRVRLQLRNEYKNFWCAEYERGKCLWIVESFGSFALFVNPWAKYNKSVEKLRAAKWIPINDNVNLRGEYVEKCEAISFEGEVGPWTFFESAFFMVQASNKDGTTAIFFIEDKKNVQWLLGAKKTPVALKLGNIIQWDEWK